ncbi:MAG: hypothetical protein IKK08_02735 [Clostridia bacterium]|nr:hypothetical protein [Clostridia bacterium]
MFDNIGEKIKLVAKVNCAIIAVACVICGFGVMFNSSFLLGLLIMAAGVLVGWAGSLVLYGFGELVDSTTVLRQAAEKQQAQSAAPVASTPHAAAESKGYSLSSMAAQRQSTVNGWVCKKCNKRNNTTAMFCSDCGTSR